jgi:hypothetical protein
VADIVEGVRGVLTKHDVTFDEYRRKRAPRQCEAHLGSLVAVSGRARRVRSTRHREVRETSSFFNSEDLPPSGCAAPGRSLHLRGILAQRGHDANLRNATLGGTGNQQI